MSPPPTVQLNCGQTLPSRYAKSALSESLSDERGVPRPEYINLYKHFASQPGIGLVISGHMMVSKKGRGEMGNVCFTKSDFESAETPLISQLKKTVEASREGNPNVKLIAQINHCGRQIPKKLLKCNFDEDGESHYKGKAISFYDQACPGLSLMFPKPLCIKGELPFLEEDDVAKSPILHELIEEYSQTAGCLVHKCGYDGIQLHTAHGYLMSDIVTNGGWAMFKRTLEACRAKIGPTAILGVKINIPDTDSSAKEYSDNLIAIANSDEILLDFIEFSAGNYSKPVMVSSDGHFTLDFGTLFRKSLEETKSSCKVMVTGRFTSKEMADKAINETKVDLVGFGRAFCLPQPFDESTARIIRGGLPLSKCFSSIIYKLGKMVPLIANGPNTMYWSSWMTKVARGEVSTNKEVEDYKIKGTGLGWYISMLRRM